MTDDGYIPRGIRFAPYVGADGPLFGPQPGVVAIANGVLEAAGNPGSYNLGIFNPRRVAGSDTWSLHAEGRAFDLGWNSGVTQTQKEAFLSTFIAIPEFALMRFISYRRLYDEKTPYGRDYTGADPHTGHAHIEFAWTSSRAMTPALVHAALNADDWGMGMTRDELKQAIREVLNEGTANGQITWAGTSKATLGTIQAVHNLVVKP